MIPTGGNDGTVTTWLILACVVFVVGYVWTSLALARLFVKLGESRARAWTPVLNIVTLLRLGEVNPAVVLFLVVPVVQVIGIIFFVLAIHTINRRFGLGAGMTVVGFFAFPVWASIIGFGRRPPIGGVVEGVSPSVWHTSETSPVQVADPVGPVWAPFVPAPVSAPAPSAASTAAAAPAALAPAVQVIPTAAPVQREPVIEHVPKPIKVSPAVDPWSQPTPPGLKEYLEGLPMDVGPAAVVEPVAQPQPQPHPLPADFDDKTAVGRRHRGPNWYLGVEGSARVRLTTASVLVGRNPRSRADYPLAQLVAVVDEEKTVSKTHAHLALTERGWKITDLDSTNGVYLVSESGDESEVEIGVAVDASESFRLGDLLVTLSAES